MKLFLSLFLASFIAMPVIAAQPTYRCTIQVATNETIGGDDFAKTFEIDLAVGDESVQLPVDSVTTVSVSLITTGIQGKEMNLWTHVTSILDGGDKLITTGLNRVPYLQRKVSGYANSMVLPSGSAPGQLPKATALANVDCRRK